MPALLRTVTITAFVLGLDQLVKLVVVVYLDLARRLALDVWPPYLNLRMAWNRGVNFGLFADSSDTGRWLLIAIAVVVSLAVLVWVRRAEGWRTPLFAGLVIGGALGNAADRALYGAVADFLNMSCCGIDNPFSFNLADVAIFLGVLGLIFAPGREAGAVGDGERR